MTDTPTPPTAKRRWLLTQNRELRREGIFNWTLPAWAGRFADGRTYNTCPEAGACRSLCYARVGTYRFRNVLAAHERNLRMILDTPEEWERQMAEELSHKRYDGKWVRLHDFLGQFSSVSRLARDDHGGRDVRQWFEVSLLPVLSQEGANGAGVLRERESGEAVHRQSGDLRGGGRQAAR